MNESAREIIRAALVIARRDFTALIRSKAFIFFLIGPIIMLGVALAAGGIGAHMVVEPRLPVIAVAMSEGDAARILSVQEQWGSMVTDVPLLEKVSPSADPALLLRDGRAGMGYAAVLSGSLRDPALATTREGAHLWPDKARLLIDSARRGGDFRRIPLTVRAVTIPVAPVPVDRSTTAQLGQMALFLTTMLLAGMVLSNLVEEKTNKIIEILAASIPMESIFLGKLFAMLAMALIAITAWAAFGAAVGLALGSALPSVPPPAVGWPVFILLGIIYFSTAYLLLGSLYLGIGAMAATVRDVQTLSMPVSMGQLGIFLFASYAMGHPGGVVDGAACIFPFSSPFAMLARAAQSPALWPHLLLIVWQGFCTWMIIRAGTAMFRRNVLKSKRVKWRKPGRARGPAT
jgi:ABC-2 type transport system permease protein